MSKHLVLDIDATLIQAKFFTQDEYNAWMLAPTTKNYLHRVTPVKIVDITDNHPKGIGEICHCILILRPYLREFLEFTLSYFDTVSVWSAGHFRYVHAVLFSIFGNEGFQRIHQIYTRADCVFLNSNGDILTKDLQSKGFDMANTLIIDDNQTSFSKNVSNAIHIPPYDPDLRDDHVFRDENSLQRLQNWIITNNIKNCPDVRLLNKLVIFPEFQERLKQIKK